jgi:hypothetical protein
MIRIPGWIVLNMKVDIELCIECGKFNSEAEEEGLSMVREGYTLCM